MFQPISTNVILQALAWHAFPLPKLRCLSVSPVSEEGIVTAEYLATWGYSLLDDMCDEAHDNAWNARSYIVDNLAECFCQDVEVKDLTGNDEQGEYTAVLYVQVDQSATVLSDWLNRAYS